MRRRTALPQLHAANGFLFPFDNPSTCQTSKTGKLKFNLNVMKMRVEEHYGASLECVYELSESHVSLLEHPKKKSPLRGLKAFVDTLKSVFLPEGYPDSVSGDYFDYQVSYFKYSPNIFKLWDSIQAITSSLTGLISTRAILQG